MTITPPLHLVLCATGKTGRRVVHELSAAGHRVRAGSRAARPPFDWDSPDSWPAVLDGVDAAYVVHTPDVGFPGAAARVGAFADTARRCGVRKLVLLSGRGEPGAAESEDAARASGVPTTVLRSSWFFQNLSESFLLSAVLDGVLALPAADVAEPFVDAGDVAACAAAALTDERHAGRTYELTGASLLTFGDVADELSRVTGREIRYVPVTASQYADGAVAAGVPADEAAAYAELFATVLDGRNATTTPDVADILGRAPADLSSWAADTAASGIWDAPTWRGAA